MQPADTRQQPRGRPRAFRTEQALDAAMRVFWSEGYEAASIDRLCRQTGMPRASLYQDFGDKKGLFLAAIDRYVETCIGPVAEALGPCGTLESDLSAFFREVVDLATKDKQTPGCLISCVLAEVAGANITFRQELDRRFSALEDRIARRLAEEPALNAKQDLRAQAGMLAAVARGIMLRARSGAQAKDLLGIAAVAVQSTIVDPK